MMTKAEWADIRRSLSYTYGRVRLEVDGYDLTIERRRYSEMKDCYCVFVGGVWNGEWQLKDCDERRRFCNRRQGLMHNKQQRKILSGFSKGQRKAAKLPEPDQKFTYYIPYWFSFESMRIHLVKNNQDIALAPDEQSTEDVTA